MANRTLGNSGIEVAPLAFGGNVFGWTIDEARSFELLDGFTAAGFNLIDTADVYSAWAPGNKGGESESIVGNWVKSRGNRDKVVIATKVGMELAPDKKGLSKEYIFRAVEDSLTRLQTDYIDLYQSHRDDAETPLEETLSAYATLIQQGKVRAIGASNYSAARLAEALEVSEKHGLPRYETLQPEYNLYERAGFEAELEPLVLKHNIGVINYFALASGFLTGKYRSEEDLTKSKRGQGNKKYLNDRGFAILKALDEISAKHGSTPARVAIAWLIARPSVTAPIASATSLDQLTDLIESTKLVLDTADIVRLDAASG
ncbi:aldo/keto reductase [Capsulimonas corticalis]|uniref:Aldo/keto reductase n=1 Tax=Capsulimonas corticalis TaxID=2219043 RepID=A0A402D3U5_9BACT|nr:aldo/keto reductase [Capsulimonas corticalis]BDI29733.1 aldo/keto reductase [Capsulimonas corticalis]